MKNWELEAMSREFPWTAGFFTDEDIPRPKVQRVDEAILTMEAVSVRGCEYGTMHEIAVRLLKKDKEEFFYVPDGKTALEVIQREGFPPVEGISLLSYYRESNGENSNYRLFLYLPKEDVAALYERLTSAAARDLRAEAEHA